MLSTHTVLAGPELLSLEDELKVSQQVYEHMHLVALTINP